MIHATRGTCFETRRHLSAGHFSHGFFFLLRQNGCSSGCTRTHTPHYLRIVYSTVSACVCSNIIHCANMRIRFICEQLHMNNPACVLANSPKYMCVCTICVRAQTFAQLHSTLSANIQLWHTRQARDACTLTYIYVHCVRIHAQTRALTKCMQSVVPRNSNQDNSRFVHTRKHAESWAVRQRQRGYLSTSTYTTPTSKTIPNLYTACAPAQRRGLWLEFARTQTMLIRRQSNLRPSFVCECVCVYVYILCKVVRTHYSPANMHLTDKKLHLVA